MSSVWPVPMAGARLRFSPFPLPPVQPESCHRIAVAAGLATVVEITETQPGAAGVLNDIGDVLVIRGRNGYFR
ncbi:hypothetical protein ACWKYD_11365 [Enterobacter cloacae]